MDSASLLSLCLAGALVPREALWSAWSLAPQATVPLLATALIYAWRVRREPRLAGWRIGCFAAGWALLVAALVSPLCRLSATLVAAHMVQHFLIVAAAAPLLVLGAPLARAPRPRLFAASAVYGLAIWLWHLPALYAAILLDPVVHALGYAALVVASLWFWSQVLRAVGSAHPLPALPALFATVVHTGVLGALLTFATRPLYPVLAAGAPAWDLSPLEDQQLAGLLMWVPMSLAYIGAALAAAGRQLATSAAPPLTRADDAHPSDTLLDHVNDMRRRV